MFPGNLKLAKHFCEVDLPALERCVVFGQSDRQIVDGETPKCCCDQYETLQLGEFMSSLNQVTLKRISLLQLPQSIRGGLVCVQMVQASKTLAKTLEWQLQVNHSTVPRHHIANSEPNQVRKILRYV